MAKLVKTFENGVIGTELTFKGEVFTITWLPWEDGVRETKEDDLGYQIKAKFPQIPDDQMDSIRDIVLDINSATQDGDIEEILGDLAGYE